MWIKVMAIELCEGSWGMQEPQLPSLLWRKAFSSLYVPIKPPALDISLD
jgi:hypothetical protein